MNKEKLEQSMKDIQEVIEKAFEISNTTMTEVSFVVTRRGFENVVCKIIKENLLQ